MTREHGVDPFDDDAAAPERAARLVRTAAAPEDRITLTDERATDETGEEIAGESPVDASGPVEGQDGGTAGADDAADARAPRGSPPAQCTTTGR